MRCSTGVWFENDVETFIQTRLAEYHDWRRAHTGHAIVGLELDDLGLVAVGSHEAKFVRDGGLVVTSTYLRCAAVRIDLQGAVLTDVDPLDGDRPVTVGRYCSKRSCRTSQHSLGYSVGLCFRKREIDPRPATRIENARHRTETFAHVNASSRIPLDADSATGVPR